MLTEEKLKHHIAHLQKQHDDLDKQIQEDYAHHDEDRLIQILKKKKLALKDEIESFKKKIEHLNANG